MGCVGGIYGIGGGSILAPVLVGTGRQPAEVAPAALASTFVTSVAGVITFTILSIHQNAHTAPDRLRPARRQPTPGAVIQSRLPDLLIHRVMGVLVLAIGIRSLWLGAS